MYLFKRISLAKKSLIILSIASLSIYISINKNLSHPEQELTQEQLIEYVAKAPSRKDLAVIEGFKKNHKVYLSLTTSPKRIKHITSILSHLDLEYVDEVLLNIPYIFNRTGEEYEIPAELVSQHPKLRIVRVANDLGPITKLLPGVIYAKDIDPEAAIITIDDDMYYPRGIINELVFQLITSNAVIAGAAFDLNTKITRNLKFSNVWYEDEGALKSFISNKIYWKNSSLRKRKFVAGFAGIAYRAHWLDTNELATYASLNTNCFKSDDLVISYTLNKHHIPIAKVKNKYINQKIIFLANFGIQDDALHKIDVNEEKYSLCLAAIEAYNS